MTDRDNPPLKPCPFCGKAPPLTSPHGQTWVVACGAHARMEAYSREEVIAAWNTRKEKPDA